MILPPICTLLQDLQQPLTYPCVIPIYIWITLGGSTRISVAVIIILYLYTDFKYNISVYLDDILQGEWNINVTSKLFEVQPIIKRSFTLMERRRDDVVLCRARIGHAYFTNGYLLRGELRPMCCNTRLTVRHVLLSCAKYAHIRRKYFAFNSLFELFRDTPAGFIIQFLRECSLYSMF